MSNEIKVNELFGYLYDLNLKETVSIKIDSIHILDEFLFYLNNEILVRPDDKFFDYPNKQRIIKKINTLSFVKFKLVENELLYENKKKDFKIYKEDKEKFYIKWLKHEFYSNIFLFSNGLLELKDTYLLLEKISVDGDIIFRACFVYQEEFEKLYNYESIKKICFKSSNNLARYSKDVITEEFNMSFLKHYKLINIDQFLDQLEKTDFMDYIKN